VRRSPASALTTNVRMVGVANFRPTNTKSAQRAGTHPFVRARTFWATVVPQLVLGVVSSAGRDVSSRDIGDRLMSRNMGDTYVWLWSRCGHDSEGDIDEGDCSSDGVRGG